MKNKLINISILLVASLVLYFMWSLFFISMGYAQSSTQVRSDNIGSKGQILINTGKTQGNQSIGNWVNSDFLKGADGRDGLDGRDGQDGRDFDFRFTQGAENVLENYGYYDYVPEVSAKINLMLNGYTQVFDFENQSTEDLTAVSWFGWRDDVNKFHTDYVLTSEYEKYSSKYQDIRIDDNKNNIIAVDKKHTIWNEKQDIRLDDIDIHNAYQDMRLDANKNNILLNRQQININADNIQNNTDEIERVDNDSIKRDKKLNKKIKKVDNKHTVWNEEQDERLDDVELYNDYQDVKINDNKNNIVNVDNRHTEWNERQDVSINNNSNKINTLNDRVDNIDSRVSDLEDTQTIIGTEIRLYDSKKWTISAFADYSTNRQMIDRTGVKFLYKIGSSYEEKRLDELERKLNLLTQEEIQDDIIITPTENGFRVTSKF